MAGGSQLVEHGVAVQWLRNGLAACHREAGADRHHHIGVVHGPRRAVVGLESHEFIVQQLREFPEYIQIGARRQARVGHAMCAIQNDAAGPLEILCLGFAMRQIDRARDMEAPLPHHLFENRPRAAPIAGWAPAWGTA